MPYPLQHVFSLGDLFLLMVVGKLDVCLYRLFHNESGHLCNYFLSAQGWFYNNHLYSCTVPPLALIDLVPRKCLGVRRRLGY
eukprot:Gb_38347 [translate_table: standard]